ncbi:hypothetical protein A1O1_03702 [Capronia coronata CBS 617.96]|uniref:Ribosomal RNA-processing protein 8 n=1 Tax=Capronia coronata CBS 617.96 TaxID=1182541 RepID=W9Z7V7_9EURO|nr:uncharacterized protein A1O1_03702 [Capronia coronata CBS 617.96]EXJ90599.1 hypothetical protein A1O1_03702 [Capronia coronata CBS 617.96]
MFAVPGWAVSPASLVQESRSSDTGKRSSSKSASDGTKRRKITHTNDEDASKITGSELEKLWNQHNGSKASDGSGQKRGRPNNESLKPKQKEPGAGRGSGEGEHEKPDAAVKTKKEKKQHNEKSERKEQAKQSYHAQNNDTQKPSKADRNGGNDGKTPTSPAASSKAIIEALPPVPTPAKLTPLQAKMRSKLTSARFRHLNETLYTTSSSAAMDLFTSSPDLFAEYHAGFSQQVKDSWPQNPVNQYISTIKSRGQLDLQPNTAKPGLTPLPRRKTGICTIADLGCGDAPLARGCQSQIKNLKLKFHNFDLHAPNTHVTKADIANLPLRDGEVDVAVFCLSLMGTNWLAFVEEAWRILRGDGKGEVWVSEVKSRFGRPKKGPGHVVENSVGKRRKKPKQNGKPDDADDDRLVGEEVFVEDSESAATDETDISAFVKVFSRRGFVLREESVDKSNKMFVSMVFVKAGVPSAGKYKWLKWNGRDYVKVHDGKMRFISGQGGKKAVDNDDDVSPEEEAKVLKPCVYKTR